MVKAEELQGVSSGTHMYASANLNKVDTVRHDREFKTRNVTEHSCLITKTQEIVRVQFSI